MTAQIIRTPGGEELVLLSRDEYEELVRAREILEEDLADLAAYDAAKAEDRGLEPLPAEVSRSILDGASRLKALRLWRKKGQVELAEQISSSQGFLSDLGTGRRSLTAEMARKLAEALDVPPHWLS